MSDKTPEDNMTPQKPSEKDLFLSALDIENPAERNAWLEQACKGDSSLLANVMELLETEKVYDDGFLTPDHQRLQEAVVVLDQALKNKGSSSEPSSQAQGESQKPGGEVTQLSEMRINETVGDTIDRYQLKKQIGEGGFGVVYLAKQTEPVQRQVALKVIKPGMDSKEVIARFETERQALALMDHPNIAKVLDAGTTAEGRPYFVMELVDGIPLNKYCEEKKLGTRERLELLLDVCSAVQHAHQKGIIHRDLKPSNILISSHDGKPVVKVIDFGIAKAISMELTGKTAFTQLGRMIGTPQYMSPEQAEPNVQDIDTRSDIYSLGVVLYELLTGTTPLEGEKMRSVAYDEMRRMIREETPVKPSTRVSTIALSHGTTVAPDSRSLRGDLDWIVLKALEKERTRRYETANDLARDIRRHLADEPVSAGPPSAVYRFKKFTRRNRRSLLSISAAAVALIIGLSVAGGLWFKEQQRISRVGQTASELITQAEQSMLEYTSSGKYDDLSSFRRASELARRAEGVLAENGGGGEMRERSRILLRAVQAEERSRTFILAIENALMRGYYKPAKSKEGSLNKVNLIAQAFSDFGFNPLQQSIEESTKSINALRGIHRDVALVGLVQWSDSLDEHELDQAKHLDKLIDHADTDPWRRKLRAAIKSEDASALMVLAESPGMLTQPSQILLELSSALSKQQLAKPVEMILRRALNEYPTDFWTNMLLGVFLTSEINQQTDGDRQHMMVSAGSMNFGDKSRGKPSSDNPIRPELNEAVGFLRAAVVARPESEIAWVFLTMTLAGSGHADQSEALLKKAVAMIPEAREFDMFIAMALLNQGKHAEAIPVLRRAGKWAKEDAGVQYLLGQTLANSGQYVEARTALLNAANLISKDPLGKTIHLKLTQVGKESDFDKTAVSLTISAQQVIRGDHDEALATYRKLLEEDPDDLRIIVARGICLLAMGEFAAAESSFKLAMQRGLKTSQVLLLYGNSLMLQKRHKDALPQYEEALRMGELGLEEVRVLIGLAQCLVELGRVDEAETTLKKAVALKRNFDIEGALHNLGNLYLKRGQQEKALDYIKKAYKINPTQPAVNKSLSNLLWKTGDIKGAIEVVNLLNDFDSYLALGASLREKKMHKESIDALQRAVALKPEKAKPHQGLALAYAAIGRYDDALKSLKIAVQLDPTLPLTHELLAATYSLRGEYEKSLSALLETLRLQSDAPISTNSNLVQLLLMTGRLSSLKLIHGDCGDTSCVIDSICKLDQQLAAHFKKNGMDTPTFQSVLRQLSGEIVPPIFGKSSLFAPRIDTLREVWENSRDEVNRRLGTVEVRMIQLRKISKDPTRTEQSQKVLAQDLLQQLATGADFKELAKKHSEDWNSGGSRSEEFGNIRPRELNDAAFGLPVNTFTKKIIEDKHAYYLLMVEARTPGLAKTFEDKGVDKIVRSVFIDQRRNAWEQKYQKRLQKPAPDIVLAKVQALMGERLIAKGEQDRAKELIQKALIIFEAQLGADDPATLRAKENLAQCIQLIEKPANPVKPEKKAPISLADLDPSKAQSIDEAREKVEQLKKRAQPVDDNLTEALNQLGLAYNVARKPEAAIESFQEAIEHVHLLHGDNHKGMVSGLVYLAQTYYSMNEYKKVVESLNRALAISEKGGWSQSTTSKIHYLIGLAYNGLDEFDLAREHLKKALKQQIDIFGTKHKSIVKIYLALGQNHVSQGEWNEAKDLYLQALKVEKSPGILGELGDVYIHLGQLDEAEKTLKDSIEGYKTKNKNLQPGDSQRRLIAFPLYSLANHYMIRGNLPEAERLAEESIMIFRQGLPPGNPKNMTRLMLAALEIRAKIAESGPSAEAVRALREVIAYRKRLNPNDPKLGRLHSALGGRLAMNNELKAGEKHVRLAEALLKPHMPQKAQIFAINQRELGVILFKQNKLVEAEQASLKGISTCEKYQQAQKELPLALLFHSRILLRAEKLQEAEKACQQVLGLIENQKEGKVEFDQSYSLMAEILTKQNRHAEAEKHLRKCLNLLKDPSQQTLLRSRLVTSLIKQKKIDETDELLSEIERWVKALKGKELSAALSTLSQLSEPLVTQKNWRTADVVLRATIRGSQTDAPRQQIAYDHFLWAKALHGLRKYDDVITALSKALNLVGDVPGGRPSPMIPAIHVGIGEALMAQGKYGKAEGEIGKAITVNEKLPRVNPLQTLAIQAYLGRVFHAQENYQRAVETYRMILKKVPSQEQKVKSTVFNALAESLVMLEQFEEAEQLIRKSIKLQQASAAGIHPGSFNVFGMILRDQKKFAEAEDQFRKAIVATDKKIDASHPGRSYVRVEFAKSLLRQKKFNQALEHASLALKLQQEGLRENHPELEETYKTLNLIHTGLGNTKKAEAFKQQSEALQKSLNQ